MTAPAASTKQPFVSVAPKVGLIGGFDGIRGTGVMMVLVGHALFMYVESWVTIVDTFFVLSGFLITNLLLQEARSTGTISLKKFYIRRGVRLLPSVWLFVGVWLVISTVATLVGFKPLSLRYVGQDALAAVTYMYHLFFPNGLYAINPVSQSHRTMWHLWTLSVEEWFYLVIAGTVLLCVKKNLVRTLMVSMFLGFAAVGVARWYGYTGVAQDDQGMLAGVRLFLLQRPDALMLGVGVACLSALITEERAEKLRRPMLWLAGFAIVVWLVMLNTSSELVEKLGGPYFKYLPDCPELGYQLPKSMGGDVCNAYAFSPRSGLLQEMYWFRFGHTIGALAFAVIAFALVRYPSWKFSTFMSWSPFRWMGCMSYTLYVWHALPYLLIIAATGGEEASLGVQLIRTPILIASAFAISLPVYYKVELKVLKAKMKYSSEKQALDLTTGKMVDVPQAGGSTKGGQNDSGPAQPSEEDRTGPQSAS